MTDDKIGPSSIVEQTKEYYNQRASQYADWAHKPGENEEISELAGLDSSYFHEAKILLDALAARSLVGNVLEIASGIGIWTEVVSMKADSVTALDSSQEMIERCRSRLKNNSKVRYVLADFYEWPPDMAYDAVTFSFWISHVPASKLDEFASKVSRCLRPGGRLFFADQQVEAMRDEVMDRQGGEIASRTLADGRKFNIIKHFYSPKEIKECFLKNGIETTVWNTPIHFYYVDGKKIL